jgi:ADP-heptose:LPS heptosyltransferase
MLAYIAGIPHRIGYDLPDVRAFLTDPIPYRAGHSVLQDLRLVERWTGPVKNDEISYRFPVTDSDRDYISSLLADAEIPATRPIVVIHPGAGTTLKRWMPESWAIVADRLSDQMGATIVFTGSDQEHPQITAVTEKMRRRSVLSLAGETNIGQLAALYERAVVVLGADSGPLHLAVASGAPTVHLYGPADPAEFGPWGDPRRQIVLTSDIGCRPCRILDWPGDSPANHPCIRDIKPQQVYEAALQASRA